MARYFFHVSDGFTRPDVTGSEFDDICGARAEALRRSREVLERIGDDEFWEHTQWRLSVTNDNGIEVLVVRVVAEETFVRASRAAHSGEKREPR